MKIIGLAVENIKRIQTMTLDPNGAAVVRVEGRNATGKSSCLDAIAYALGGKALVPERPVREGQETAKVVVNLGEMIVERRWTQGGKRSVLEVCKPDGSKLRSPQAILDEIVGSISFDPLAFVRKAPKEQAIVLRELVGLDFSAKDGERRRLFDERRDVNRDAKSLQARVAGLNPEADAPDEEVSVAELAAEHAAAVELRREIGDARDRQAEAAHHLESLRSRLEEALRTVEKLRSDVKVAEAGLEGCRGRCDGMPMPPDVDAIAARMRSAEDINARVRQRREREGLVRKFDELNFSSESFTEAIAAIDEGKATTLAAATWPVEGLSLEEDVVTFGGLPLAQASSAEQLRVSVAIGFALNPKLRVLLVREGSLLDDASLLALGDVARKADAQIWIELVGQGELSVIFEEADAERVAVLVAEAEAN